MARPRLFSALEAAFPVRFLPWGDGGDGVDAILAVGEQAAHDAAQSSLPVLAVLDDGRAPATVSDARFLEHRRVDRRLQGVALPSTLLTRPLAPAEGEDVLATAGGDAVWTCRRGPVPVHRLGSSLPELGPTEVLRATLAGPRALTVVVLVHFLRGLTLPAGWRPPPTRATFLFDDPNLRRPSYGFINFERLVAHADEHGYHAAMAMIPLDVRWQHRATVSLFKRRADRLSLVYHGNNHSRRELLETTTQVDAEALAAQAVRRMAAFERRWGLVVHRVMTAPHGMCSQSMARALAAVGFDALCAIHPVPWLEQPPPDRLLAGWEPAEFPVGCAVIPRHPLWATDGDIALPAFLDQPVVLYGHHEDVAGGLEPLEAAAARVNRLGAVEWTSLDAIARTNYRLRIDGEAARLRPFARRIALNIPSGASTLAVEAPRGADGAFAGWSADGGPSVPFGDAVPCRGMRSIELRAARALAPDAVPAPAWSPWPVLRRAATEARDRAWPLRAAV